MSTILAYVDLTLAGYVAVFVATLVFSQKIKDFLAGVPADMRTGLQALETSVKTDVKTYQASLIAKINPVKTPVAPAAATPADRTALPAAAPAAPAA
jgi:hypothetical protein